MLAIDFAATARSTEDGNYSDTNDKSRGRQHLTWQGKPASHVLRGTCTVGHKWLLRTRCRGEVRRRHGMRVRIGRGNSGRQEVSVLRLVRFFQIVRHLFRNWLVAEA